VLQVQVAVLLGPGTKQEPNPRAGPRGLVGPAGAGALCLAARSDVAGPKQFWKQFLESWEEGKERSRAASRGKLVEKFHEEEVEDGGGAR